MEKIEGCAHTLEVINLEKLTIKGIMNSKKTREQKALEVSLVRARRAARNGEYLVA